MPFHWALRSPIERGIARSDKVRLEEDIAPADDITDGGWICTPCCLERSFPVEEWVEWTRKEHPAGDSTVETVAAVRAKADEIGHAIDTNVRHGAAFDVQ